MILWKSLINKQHKERENCLKSELSETVKLLTKTRHKNYKQGERISRVLAQLIKKQAASRLITEIRSGTGIVTKDLKEINYTFKKLYTSESQKDSTIIEAFFKKIMTPTIKLEYIEQLKKPITKQEIKQAINSMQSSKAPGPDGYSSELSH